MNSKFSQHTTDEELLEFCKRGDQRAFKYLIERHEGVVATTIRSMVGDEHSAKDIGQEVFIRFYRSMHAFRGDSSLKTYLTRIAINLSLNELKRRKRKRWLRLFSDDKEVEFPDYHSSSNTDLKEVIDRSLQTLSEKIRSVVILRLIQGFSTEETAHILNIPPGTVMSRLSRGQTQLQKQLMEQGVVS